jgi:hypothetical protein
MLLENRRARRHTFTINPVDDSVTPLVDGKSTGRLWMIRVVPTDPLVYLVPQ